MKPKPILTFRLDHFDGAGHSAIYAPAQHALCGICFDRRAVGCEDQRPVFFVLTDGLPI